MTLGRATKLIDWKPMVPGASLALPHQLQLQFLLQRSLKKGLATTGRRGDRRAAAAGRGDAGGATRRSAEAPSDQLCRLQCRGTGLETLLVISCLTFSAAA